MWDGAARVARLHGGEGCSPLPHHEVIEAEGGCAKIGGEVEGAPLDFTLQIKAREGVFGGKIGGCDRHEEGGIRVIRHAVILAHTVCDDAALLARGGDDRATRAHTEAIHATAACEMGDEVVGCRFLDIRAIVFIHDFVDMDMYYSMIKGLKDEQRQVVTLKVLGGYTHKEIAAMLGKPIGTIQWIYNTSVKKLKVMLSSIMLTIFASVFGFVKRLTNYIEQIKAVPEIPGQTVHIPFDYFIVIFALIFAILISVFTIIYIKSYRIPTKAERKSI